MARPKKNQATADQLASPNPAHNITGADLEALELELHRAGFVVSRRTIVPAAPGGALPSRTLELSDAELAPEQLAQIHIELQGFEGKSLNAALAAEMWADGGIAGVIRLWQDLNPSNPEGWRQHLMSLPAIEAAVQEVLRGGHRILFARSE